MPLELNLKVVVSYLTWVLKTEHGFSKSSKSGSNQNHLSSPRMVFILRDSLTSASTVLKSKAFTTAPARTYRFVVNCIIHRLGRLLYINEYI